MAIGQTLAAYDAVLKEVYVGPIRDQLNQKTVLLDAFTKGDIEKIKWEGREAVVPLHSSRNYSGVLAVAENGTLPVAGQQGYTDLKIPMEYVYGRIQLITGWLGVQ